ncbi:probable polyamine transporter At3g13620 [Arachis hypogaea]|uniref:probable polyamine transporter At3g13620 n=1 Tax=Arachis hypogaea TaxID=3818 RepID=UPI003B228EC0|nr:putative polyamine transporter [Arachis hypogaea]
MKQEDIRYAFPYIIRFAYVYVYVYAYVYVGLFEAQLTSAAYQLLGIADLGFIPKIFGDRLKKFNTLWMGILVSTIIVVAMSFFSFNEIISTVNFLYSLGMLLEFASFLWLRRKFPSLKRPFEVPLGMKSLIVICLIPSFCLLYVISVANKNLEK